MSQNLSARMISESVREGLEKALSPMLQGLIGGIIMPVIPSALAMLDGWTWRNESIETRQTLVRGAGPTPLFAPIQGEKGWLNFLLVLFSDPVSELHFQCDNWNVKWSPLGINISGGLQSSNSLNNINVYNPATLVGPMYGVQWSPSQFWPYNNQIIVQVSHPAFAPTATSQLIGAGMGRHYIRDEKQFYQSIIREGMKQTRGTVEIPGGRR